MGRQRLTDFYWDPYPVRPSGGARYDTLPIPDEEKEEVAKREKERRARGFGFAPQEVVWLDDEVEEKKEGYLYPGAIVGLSMPQLWEGDQA